MFNRFTYYFVAAFITFIMPQGAMGASFHTHFSHQDAINQDTDISALLEQIYIVNRTDVKEAERLSKKAFVTLQKNTDNGLLARLFNLTAYRKFLSMKINASLIDVLEARRLAKVVGNKEEEATSYRLEGNIYTLIGDYSQAVTLFFRALAMQKSLPNDDTYSTFQNISLVYYEMEDYENLLKYAYILLKHPTSIAGSLEEGIAYNTIASTLIELGDYSKARVMFKNAENIFKIHNAVYIYSVMFGLADLEYRQKDYQKALTLVTDSINLAKKRNYATTHYHSLSLKANIQAEMGDVTGALKTLEELVRYAVANKNPKAEQEAYGQYALIYESQGKYQEALEAHQKFKQITDSLFNDRSTTKIALAQTRFEMEQKEQTIALLEAEAALDISRHAQLEKATTLRGYIIVLVILMFFGAVIVVLRNVRTRRVLEKNSDKLKEARRQADDANNSKSTFLASMSHDLRTPLNAILGYSEAIQMEINGPLGNAAYQDYIGSINKSGKLLLELIDDVLDLSKVEAGKYELSESKISLPDVINRTLDMVRPIAQSKEINIEYVCPDGLPRLLADERVLVQILNNLISNSLKFTDFKGKVLLESVLAADGGMSISISDNGIGMTESELQRAIRPFEQIDPEVSQNNMGTGLGLTLCIKYMELHGGQLTVTSEKNVGTTTILHFPAECTVK